MAFVKNDELLIQTSTLNIKTNLKMVITVFVKTNQNAFKNKYKTTKNHDYQIFLFNKK